MKPKKNKKIKKKILVDAGLEPLTTGFIAGRSSLCARRAFRYNVILMIWVDFWVEIGQVTQD